MGRPRLKLNHQALDADTPEAQYWRGFLAITANVIYRPGNDPRIVVEVPAEDYNHLVTFKEFIAAQHGIILYRNSARLSFASQPMAVCLYEHGLSRRPYAVRKPIKDNSIEFWRGVVDGGGCIGRYNGYARLQLVGQEALLQAMQKYVEETLGYITTIRACRKKKCITWNGAPAAYILKHLYDRQGVRSFNRQLKVTALLFPRAIPRGWDLSKPVR